MSDTNELDDKLDQLNATAKEIGEQLKAATDDEGRFNELKSRLDTVEADQLSVAIEKAVAQREAEANDRILALEKRLSETRTKSKAHLFGGGKNEPDDNFFAALAMAQNVRLSGSTERSAQAKASLASMGSVWNDPDPAAKATVGDTDAAGGYLVPNAVVSAINLQATPLRQVVDLFTTINGVRGNQVDMPWEQGVPTRAVIAAAGATKENQDFIVNNYTATLYTLARIMDVSNQLLRQSAGAAEQLVRSKLARAMGLGEDYYALSGSGSSQPYGLLTALGTSGQWVTTTTPSATTLAGSVASAIAKLAGVVANRGADPNGAVMNTADYWTMLGQGTDSAGFFFAPAEGPNAINGANGLISPFGIPIRHSPNMTADNLVVGDFKAAYFFRGDGYRVDTSSEAGTRWDTNLTGFRAEEEIAFDARPTVYTGHFQRSVDIIA